jgi:hypothetical protein
MKNVNQRHIKVDSGQVKFDRPFIHLNGKYYEFNGTDEGLVPLGPLQLILTWEGKENATE